MCIIIQWCPCLDTYWCELIPCFPAVSSLPVSIWAGGGILETLLTLVNSSSCQFLCPHCHVLVLRPGSSRALHPTISMVEKVHHTTAALSICSLRPLRNGSVLQSTKLSHFLDVLCHDTATTILLSFLWFLHEIVSRAASIEKNQIQTGLPSITAAWQWNQKRSLTLVSLLLVWGFDFPINN